MTLPDHIHHDLLNWARYSWSGPYPHPLPQSRAASAEGRWVPPSDLGNEEQEDKPPPINRDRAKKIDALYLDGIWGNAERWVMWAEYIHRHMFMKKDKRSNPFFDRNAAARKVGYPLSVYEANLRSAARIAGQAMGE